MNLVKPFEKTYKKEKQANHKKEFSLDIEPFSCSRSVILVVRSSPTDRDRVIEDTAGLLANASSPL